MGSDFAAWGSPGLSRQGRVGTARPRGHLPADVVGLKWGQALGLGVHRNCFARAGSRLRDGAALFRLTSNDCPGRTSSTPNPKA